MTVAQVPEWESDLKIPIRDSIPDLRQTHLSEKLLDTALL